MKILIADDSHISHRLLELMIQHENHTIFSARDGLEAVDKLNAVEFDLLVTDIRMPGMDGLSLLAYVRSEERFQDLPVIVMSAGGQEQLHTEALVRGATAFLSQPFSSREFRQLVTECLNNSKPDPLNLPARQTSAMNNLPV